MDLKEVLEKIEKGEIKSSFVEHFSRAKEEDFKMQDTEFVPVASEGSVSAAEEKDFLEHLAENAELTGYKPRGHAPVTAGENTTKIAIYREEK